MKEKAPSESVGMHSLEDLRREAIPVSSAPDIRNRCPGCALEIDASTSRCPRCGIPLRSETTVGTATPKPEPPVQETRVIPVVPIVSEPPTPPLEPEGQSVQTEGTLTPTPVEQRSETDFIKSRGATNGSGLVNGRGMVNGTGLVNGIGMVNGTGMTNGTRRIAVSAKSSRTPVFKRWQFLAVLVAIAIVLPTFVYLSYGRSSEFAVDGRFDEWNDVTMFGMRAPAALPEVTVDEWAIKTDSTALYMYLRTASDVVGTSNVDSFYLFIDSDGNRDTGYSISTIGADHMVELHGWSQKVESAQLMQFASDADQFNWTSWSGAGSVTVATEADELEAMVDLPIQLTADARFLLLSQDNLPDQANSVSYPVPEEGGALIIELESGSGLNQLNGIVLSASSVSLARLKVSCEGSPGTIYSISPEISGATLVSQIADEEISPGQTRSYDVIIDTSSAPPGNFVSATVTEDSVSSTFSEVVVVGDPIRAYVSGPPNYIWIDGAFGDWFGRTTTDTDNGTLDNPNIDINAVGSVNVSAYSAFYVSVKDQLFEGSYVPSMRGKPTSQGGGGVPVTPHRKSGEDILRIYIDSDILNMTGNQVQRSGKLIGADYMLEIQGVDGKVVSKTLMISDSGAWTPMSATINAASDSQRIEVGFPSEFLGGSTSLVAIIETTDWRSRSDWAWTGALPDPWVIDALGNTYMSNDGATWSFLGKPTLQSGDYIVDISISLGAQGGDIFLVTNTGRTFYWIPGTSTNWETGQTDPIDVANYSEAVAMSFYQNAGAWLMTKNGSYFWLMDAHKSSKPWTYQDNVGPGITDYTDLSYNSGTMYALRSGANTPLNYSNNGNSFSAVTAPTGSVSTQVQLTYIPGGAGSDDDRVFVLCENGNIRYSSNGGSTWSSLGNLPVPSGGNLSKYTDFGIDPTGYMWVVTDTGYTYRSTDTSTYTTFVYTGQSPIGSIVAVLPTTAIPEFPLAVVPAALMILMVVLPRCGRRRNH